MEGSAEHGLVISLDQWLTEKSDKSLALHIQCEVLQALITVNHI